MGKLRVFVTYRREDSRHQRDGICDHLVPQFGKDCVFQDVDNQIPPGRDFRSGQSGGRSQNGVDRPAADRGVSDVIWPTGRVAGGGRGSADAHRCGGASVVGIVVVEVHGS